MGAILAMNVHHYRGTLTLPDREITGSGPAAIVGNGRQAGGGLQVTPRARVDDGLLDVLAVRDIPALALLTAARELQELSPDGEYINYWQTPWAEVHTEETIPVNLDGEPVQFSSVRYEDRSSDSPYCSAGLSTIIGPSLKGVWKRTRRRKRSGKIRSTIRASKNSLPLYRTEDGRQIRRRSLVQYIHLGSNGRNKK